MKLSTLLWRGLLLTAVVAGLGQWMLVQRTQEAVARFAARLVPYGDLHYDRLWPWPWGSARAWGVSFRPEGMLQIHLRTAPGLAVRAGELQVRELRWGEDGTVERVRGRLIGVRLPVAEQRAPVPETFDAAHPVWPTLYDLGYTELGFDLDFDLQYVASARLAHLRLDAAGEGLGQARLDAQLEGTPQTFDRAPDQILVRRVDLRFTDAGLLARLKDVSAARARLDRAAFEAALIEQLERRAKREKWKWDAASAAAARGLIRDPSALHLRIDPPGDVMLRNIRLYPMADWPLLLGFSIGTGRPG
jgi:hypothetical protein